MSDTALCVLALSLTYLVSLSVWECELITQAPLPVLASLTKLSNLALSSSQSMCLEDTGLMLLSRLTGLNSLTLPVMNHVSAAGLDAFLQRMPHLYEVHF